VYEAEAVQSYVNGDKIYAGINARALAAGDPPSPGCRVKMDEVRPWSSIRLRNGYHVRYEAETGLDRFLAIGICSRIGGPVLTANLTATGRKTLPLVY
jgi:hypothetical protein